MSIESCETLAQLVDALSESYGDRVLLPRRDSRGGDPVSYRQFHENVRRLAAGLLDCGLELGDRVALISENRYEWLLCDLACTYIGLIDVPRGTDTAGSELEMILRHSGCRFAIAEDAKAATELDLLRKKLPELQHVCVMLDSPEVPDGVMSLDQILTRGDRLLATAPERLAEASSKLQAEDIATIVYTSGTTADPKGVVLSHHNLLCNMRGVTEILDFDRDDVFLSVLPAWHAYERMLDYVAMCVGARIWFTDRRRLRDDMREIRPTAFAAVPRIWESIHDGIVNYCHKQPWAKRKLLSLVLANCRRVGDGSAGPLRRSLHWLYKRNILPKFLASTGGRLRFAVSGGGSLPLHVDACLVGMGLPILNGYGLTETSPVASLRTPENNVVGTIGRPLPHTSFEIRDEGGDTVEQGEIGIVWIRGPQVMKGYFRNPERTAQVIDANGWFNTGDLGCLEIDGNVRITGRAKDTIVLAGGENVEPEHLETQLKTSPFIDQAVVLGQDRKTLSAILVPMTECLEQEFPREEWREQDGVIRSKVVQAFYRRELDRLLSRSAGFRPTERVASFRIILEPFSAENGLLTQTLKLRRHCIAAHHQRVMAELIG